MTQQQYIINRKVNIVELANTLGNISDLRLRLRLKMSGSPLSEFISQDPKLNWFWNDLKNQLEYHS